MINFDIHFFRFQLKLVFISYSRTNFSTIAVKYRFKKIAKLYWKPNFKYSYSDISVQNLLLQFLKVTVRLINFMKKKKKTKLYFITNGKIHFHFRVNMRNITKAVTAIVRLVKIIIHVDELPKFDGTAKYSSSFLHSL